MRKYKGSRMLIDEEQVVPGADGEVLPTQEKVGVG